jgi:hypothetical protein
MPVITSLVDEFREDIATFRANGMTMAERRAHATEVGLESLGPTIKSEFEDMISADGYSCRWRPDSEKHTKMCVVLSDSTAIRTASDRNLHHWAREHFELREQGRVLYKSPDDDYKEYRRVLWPSEVFDTIARAHLRALHTGRDKTWKDLDQQFYGLKKSEVMWIISHCLFCLTNKATFTKAPLEPIIADEVFKRIQCDLVDMRHEPSGRYKWVLHIKDHFSKFSFLFPLVSKHS